MASALPWMSETTAVRTTDLSVGEGFTKTGPVRGLPGPDGKLVHACLKIGDSQIMLADVREECGMKGPDALGGTPVSIHLQVEDVDAVFNQAIEAGATLIMPVMEMFWGDRYGQVDDPFGHRWSVATHVRDLSYEEIQAGMLAMFEQNQNG
jgi:uncharacterized glyoxalase superfamily protein PhnB